MANTASPQSPLAAIRHSYAKPTFKTNELCLASNVQRLKQLLLLYDDYIIQC